MRIIAFDLNSVDWKIGDEAIVAPVAKEVSKRRTILRLLKTSKNRQKVDISTHKCAGVLCYT